MTSNLLATSRRRRACPMMAFAAALALTTTALACNVPVFRFALERWRPDAYRLTLLHRGPLTDAQREMIRPLADAQDKGAANFVLRTLDVSEIEKLEPDEAPLQTGIPDRISSRLMAGDAWLIVNYPAHLRIGVLPWDGPLTCDAANLTANSPVRQELIKRLTEGQTTVWIVLESGQTEIDDVAVKQVETQMRQLEQTLKLPELTSDPSDELLASTPLKVAFSVLRIPQAAIEEQALTAMLSRCEPDLLDRPNPIVFPVFGRGRSLLPLIGAGITEKNIQDAAEFLVGPCSCQVKELNPGFDLLLAADWDALLTQSGQKLRAIRTRGVAPLAAGTREGELVPIPTGSRNEVTAAKQAPQHESENVTSSTSHYTWIITSAFLLGVVAFVVLLSATHASKS